MSRVERNARREAEKKRAARRVRVRDVVVIFACLIMALAYVSSLSKITPEPEYVFAGGSSKEVPVYLIGIPVDDEEGSEETAEAGQNDSSAKAVKVGKVSYKVRKK